MSDIPLEVRAAVGAVALEASNLEFTMCRVASEVLPVASWEEHGPDVDRWMAKPGKPLQQLKAAASLLEGERAVQTHAWIERCEALLQRRHRIVHGVFGYDFFGRLMFGFGRRDNPEVLDVAGIEALAAELHLAGQEHP